MRTPASLKPQEEVDAFVALNADVAVVAAYGLILRENILNAPRLGCINIHASLLPRWRGAAPIQRAIQAGDSETPAFASHIYVPATVRRSMELRDGFHYMNPICCAHSPYL